MKFLKKMDGITFMKFTFDTNYSEEELKFIKENDCVILSEIKLSKTNFAENEYPRRMFRFGGTYVGEIFDEEINDFSWAVLSKWKGVYQFTSYYNTLQQLEQGL